MDTPLSLRLLASTNNARGDLFTRLVKDLFFALGYDDLRLDVHKSGREIDIQGTHRLEPRRMAAECKAHAKKMGGADMNKFFGALTRERDKHKPTPVAGYFVSLSGFRETGKEQELETSKQKRIILLDGKQVIHELVRAKILVSHTEATEQAGHCAEHAGLKTSTLDGIELLGHEIGYLWAVFYSQSKQRTHFSLVHADGTPLAEAVAQEVIKVDRKCKGTLHSLVYLTPPSPAPDRKAVANTALDRYRRWVTEECGYIQLDGLPADADLSAFRMNLERLFVPLKLVAHTGRPADEQQSNRKKKRKEWIGPVGDFLDTHPQFSLLAKPGGGKSTLLKRLATAYAAPESRDKADDRLPKRDWLPLLLRCRELRDRAHRPIRELMDDLPQHAGMTVDEGAAFRGQIDEALRSGRALLLVDGLDEISDEGARRTFAQHLRTFLAMFPHTATVVTSREAGFRQVASVVAGVGDHARLAPFDKDDVRRLCECWHVEVVGDNDKVRSEARELADKIWGNERIRSLAENPLMLTTLLVVKRWIGELPRKRVDLYREAVKVLIQTWNTEGFEPMNLDETLARLSYVGCAMMEAGEQRIGHKRLLKLLQKARQELSPELGFARVNETEFIERIEYRSSLLMQTGHELIDGELQPVYEFRHLTFQEYLAARGLVEEQYPGRDQCQSLAELLEPHFKDERWREVVPLAAVLAGRRAEETVKRLTRSSKDLPLDTNETILSDENLCVFLLMQCLLDEVLVTPATLREALIQLARYCELIGCEELLRGKFGGLFEQLVDDAYFGACEDWEDYAWAESELAINVHLHSVRTPISDTLLASLAEVLANGDRKEKVRAALASMDIAFRYSTVDTKTTSPPVDPRFQPIYDALVPLVDPNDPPLALAATWALAWIGTHGLWRPPPRPDWLILLYRIWREAASAELARRAAWVFMVQKALPRNTFNPNVWGDCDAFLHKTSKGDTRTRKEGAKAALVVGWYRGAPWDDISLAHKLNQNTVGSTSRFVFYELVAALGDVGKESLENWNK